MHLYAYRELEPLLHETVVTVLFHRRLFVEVANVRLLLTTTYVSHVGPTSPSIVIIAHHQIRRFFGLSELWSKMGRTKVNFGWGPNETKAIAIDRNG